MRIDLNYGPQSTSQTDRASAQSNAVAGGSQFTSVPGEDQAHLSAGHAQVDALAAQAAQLPEVRQERVQALRQVLLRGQYNPRPERIAGAMVDYMLASPAV